VAEGRDCLATLSYIYDHAARELPKRLTQEFHDHHGIAQATLHVHLDHDSCLEVTVLKGKSSEVKAFADRVIAERGVRMVTSRSCQRTPGRISVVTMTIIATIALPPAVKNVKAKRGFCPTQ
jgi:metal-responsive CopG/Arc/MetJ family transcriptional regulator